MNKVRYLPVSWNVGAAASVVLLFLVVAGGCASGPGVGNPAPSFVIVGKDGKVIFNQTGFAEGDGAKFEALIDAHLDAVESGTRGIH
jgi:hypothetical protein